MRESVPNACATWDTSALVASQSADIALMEEMRCARKAFAASLESSADHRLARRMRSWGTQLAYTSARASTAALRALDLAADEDAVGLVEVRHGGALGEELGVGEDVETHGGVGAVAAEHLLDRLGGAHGDGGLLDDDLVCLGHRRDGASGGFPVGEIRSLTRAETGLLGGSVDGDEDHLGGGDGAGDVGGEEEVLAAARLDDLVEAGLVDGRVGRCSRRRCEAG